jgi:hypothetical protein
VGRVGHAEYDHVGIVTIGKVLVNRLISAVRIANQDFAAAVPEVGELSSAKIERSEPARVTLFKPTLRMRNAKGEPSHETPSRLRKVVRESSQRKNCKIE